MATLDWIIGAVLLASMVLGIWRGLVYEVLSVLSWLAAFLLAQWLAPDAAARLPMQGAGAPLRYAGGFVLVFVAAAFAGGLIAFLMSKLVSAVGLGPMDRALGAMFGLLRGVVLVLAAAAVISLTPLRESTPWQESVGAHWAGSALHVLKPVLPQDFGKYLP